MPVTRVAAVAFDVMLNGLPEIVVEPSPSSVIPLVPGIETEEAHVHVPPGILTVYPLKALLIAVCTSVAEHEFAVMMPPVCVVALACVLVADVFPAPS